jgi:hypothetical protein
VITIQQGTKAERSSLIFAQDAELDEPAQTPDVSLEQHDSETPADHLPPTSDNEVTIRKSKKRDASQDLSERRQGPERAATREVRYCSSGPQVVADSIGLERKLPFAFESRLSAVEDRAAAILKDSKSLKAQIQDLKARVASLTQEFERIQKEMLTTLISTKAEITAEVKGLTDDTTCGYLFQNKMVAVTKHVTK